MTTIRGVEFDEGGFRTVGELSKVGWGEKWEWVNGISGNSSNKTSDEKRERKYTEYTHTRRRRIKRNEW